MRELAEGVGWGRLGPLRGWTAASRPAGVMSASPTEGLEAKDPGLIGLWARPGLWPSRPHGSANPPPECEQISEERVKPVWAAPLFAGDLHLLLN